MRHYFVFIFCLVWLSIGAQEQYYGSWSGRMQSEIGKYEFSLNISEIRVKSDTDKKDCRSRNIFTARAMHNRNGKPEVIELEGILYQDHSIYFSDINDRWEMQKQGKGFSRLQFVLKFENGKPFLDGHWQEYEDIRRYRKGRLVLQKQNSKV